MPPKNPKVTRSSASRRQQRQINSLVSGSSPPKVTRTKKSIESPEVTGITHQVVTVTKQAKSSEDSSSEDNSKQESTGSDSNRSSVNQVGTTINLSNMADPRLDKQLDHVLE